MGYMSQKNKWGIYLSRAVAVLGACVVGIWMCMTYGTAKKTQAAEDSTKTLKLFDVIDFEADYDHASSHAEPIYKYRFTAGEKQMLQKIGVAEAGETDATAILHVMRVILNRKENTEGLFPDDIEGVLFQKIEGAFQFSCVAPFGRYWSAEPNEASEEALERLMLGEDGTQGALFFHSDEVESCWASRNREFIYQYGGHLFYR